MNTNNDLNLATLLTCSQCGQRFSERACGPTHAIIAANPAQHRAVAPLIEKERDRTLAPFKELFVGGPDTPCRTTWPNDGNAGPIECVEVPMADLREAFDRAEAKT